MKILAISSFAHNGQHIEAGTEIEVSDVDGKVIVGTGRAVPSKADSVPPVIETAALAPAVEHAEATQGKPSKKIRA